jgi:transglutaminase-like putative cysteine protease
LHHRRIEKVFHFEMTLATAHCGSTPALRDNNVPPSGIGAFLLPSALCNFTPEVCDAARELNGATPIEICDFVFRRLEYSRHATTLKTSASQSLQFGRGVCQDFAHAMIAICRALKIPARYISGYLPGEGASHAWCEVFWDGAWHAFDPTHNRAARAEYVFVACGRDFRDCASHSGTFRGSAKATLQSFCKTTAGNKLIGK